MSQGFFPLKSLLQPRSLWVISWVWIGVIALLTLFWGIGDIGLIDETEPLFVEAARQMEITGDWVTPYFDNVTRFDKPPLIYWLMVLCFKIFGVSEWAARIPSAVSALLLVSLSFCTLQRFHPSLSPASQSVPSQSRPGLAPWLGATMLMLNLNTYFWGRTGYADMLFAACLAGSFLAFFMGYAQPSQPTAQSQWYAAFYVLLALSILTKGPVAVVLAVLILIGFGVYLGNLRQIVREMRLLPGILLIAALTLPWYILVTLANGKAFIDSFFGYHNLVRFSSVVHQHSGPWYFHFLVILLGFLPWSAYLPVALYSIQPWQRAQWQQRSRPDQLGLYALVWFAVILGFFTLSVTKYFSYTLPLLPAAAILVSLWWTDAIQSDSSPRWSPSRWFNVLLLGGLAGAMWACPAWLTQDPWMPHLGDHIAAAHLHILGGALWAIATLAAITCILCRSNGLWLVNTVAFILFIGFILHPAISIVDQERQLPLREMARSAVKAQKPGEELIMVGFEKPSLVFYTQGHVEYIETPEQLQPYLKQARHPGHLLITTPQLLAQTKLQPNQYQHIDQAGVYTLVRL